jgi:putative ABC transport system permease protein
MSDLARNLRYALRILIRTPGLTIIAVCVLALGIGANTAIFTIVNTVLLRHLPYANPDRLVRISLVRTEHINADQPLSYPDFVDLQSQAPVFEHVAVHRAYRFVMPHSGGSVHLTGAIVSADMFSLLGVSPEMGRSFLPQEDDQPAAGNLPVVVSHRFWETYLNSDRNVIGQSLQLNHQAFLVVGVMPSGFEFPIQADPVDLWTTTAIDKSFKSQRGTHIFQVIARLRSATPMYEATTQLNTIMSRLAQQYPETDKGIALRVTAESEHIVGDIRPALLVLFAATGLVLLIACVNLANLFLVQTAVRQKEIAIRLALGASRGRVVRQLLLEAGLLAFSGGILGFVLAVWGTTTLVKLSPRTIPRMAEVTTDQRVFLFAMVASSLTVALFGLLPSLEAYKAGVAESLKGAGQSASGTLRHNRIRGLLVIVQLALSLTLLVSAGLLINSFRHLTQVNPGFNFNNLLTARISLLGGFYSDEKATAFFDQLLSRTDALPGVRGSAVAYPLPLSTGNELAVGFAIEGRNIAPTSQPTTNLSLVSPNYFKIMGVSLLGGREFTGADTMTAKPVAIINETLAQRFFPGQNPLGRHIQPGISASGNPPMREIVGVVRNMKNHGLSASDSLEIYLPFKQMDFYSVSLIVRSELQPTLVATALRKLVSDIDPQVPVYDVRTMDQYLGTSVAQPRFNATLLGAFAGFALLLAALGIYGVIAYSVTQRRRELSIRMALGARRLDALKLVLREGAFLVLIGLAFGTVGALGSARLLASLLFGIKPTDPFTFLCVLLVLALVGMVAVYIPAYAASRVNPVAVLKEE